MDNFIPTDSNGDKASTSRNIPQNNNGQHSEFKLPQSVIQSTGGGKAMNPSKVKAKEEVEHGTEEYQRRRKRNNVAVKKSREKTKEKAMNTSEHIEKLKVENVQLEQKVETLNKELDILKKVFMDHAKGFSGGGGSELPDLKQLEVLLGHKLTDTSSTSSENNPSTSRNDS